MTDSEYDIIFAGAGTAGCVAGGRLASSSPSLRILLIEAGGHTKDQERFVMPGRFNENVEPGPGSDAIWAYEGERSAYLGGRRLRVHAGRGVGGGSSVNFMMYTRASASDYDEWAGRYGNEGWSAEALIPLLRKLETYQPGLGSENSESKSNTHGRAGPLKVSYGGTFTDIGRQALDVAREYDPARPVVEDANDLRTTNAYARWAKWIDGETGKRSDSAHAYIYSQEHNKNLHVLTDKLVVRVIIENGRAVGVEYQDAAGTTSVTRAKRMVILSAGSFGSPGILERSGIGRKDVLEKNGVAQIVDLPGVGENLQDHPVAFPVYYAADECETVDVLYRHGSKEAEQCQAQWRKDGTGICAHNAYDVALKMQPDARNLQELGPEYLERWGDEFYKQNPDKCLTLLMPCSGIVGSHSDVPDRKYIGGCYYMCYPLSTGSVHINSGTDPSKPPKLIDNFLDNTSDVAVMRLAYKRLREWIRRIPAYRGELQQRHPVFPAGSEAACKETDGPVAIDAPDLVYSAEDDKAIEKFHRDFVTSARHALGTCAMKPRDQGGVVDARLNVYGIRSLKVADLSIAPSNVAANTHSSALLIGEKAAALIAGDLGLDI